MWQIKPTNQRMGRGVDGNDYFEEMDVQGIRNLRLKIKPDQLRLVQLGACEIREQRWHCCREEASLMTGVESVIGTRNRVLSGI
jgi:hypothetical protein